MHVTECSYLGSQPWPFPRSLMVGFAARAEPRRVAADRGRARSRRPTGWTARRSGDDRRGARRPRVLCRPGGHVGGCRRTCGPTPRPVTALPGLGLREGLPGPVSIARRMIEGWVAPPDDPAQARVGRRSVGIGGRAPPRHRRRELRRVDGCRTGVRACRRESGRAGRARRRATGGGARPVRPGLRAGRGRHRKDADDHPPDRPPGRSGAHPLSEVLAVTFTTRAAGDDWRGGCGDLLGRDARRDGDVRDGGSGLGRPGTRRISGGTASSPSCSVRWSGGRRCRRRRRGAATSASSRTASTSPVRRKASASAGRCWRS